MGLRVCVLKVESLAAAGRQSVEYFEALLLAARLLHWRLEELQGLWAAVQHMCPALPLRVFVHDGTLAVVWVRM